MKQKLLKFIFNVLSEIGRSMRVTKCIENHRFFLILEGFCVGFMD